MQLGGVVQSSAIVGPTTKSGGKSKFPLWIMCVKIDRFFRSHKPLTFHYSGVIIGGAVALALIVAGVAWLVHRQSQKAATAGFSSGRAGWGHAMEGAFAECSQVLWRATDCLRTDLYAQPA